MRYLLRPAVPRIVVDCPAVVAHVRPNYVLYILLFQPFCGDTMVCQRTSYWPELMDACVHTDCSMGTIYTVDRHDKLLGQDCQCPASCQSFCSVLLRCHPSRNTSRVDPHLQAWSCTITYTQCFLPPHRVTCTLSSGSRRWRLPVGPSESSDGHQMVGPA